MDFQLERVVLDEFDRLRSLDEDSREIELERLTRSRPEVAGRVRALFHDLPETADFLEAPLLELSFQTPLVQSRSIPRDHVTAWIEPPLESSRFQFRKQLGAGSFGVVYEAFDTTRRTTVAVKHLRHASATSLYRFKREFRALQELYHPNLVLLHELLTVDDHWYLTMELVEGADLRTFLADKPADDVRAIFRQFAEAVAALHQAGKLHRDLKPTNVLVTGDGTVKVLDFGLIAELDTAVESVAASKQIGTPAYMSPEQAVRQPVSEASDWYSFGMMLYEVLMDFLPSRAHLLDVADLILPDTPPTDVPRDLWEICLGTLKREPARRMTGTEVLRRLSVSPAAGIVSKSVFIGRREILEILQEQSDAVRNGSGKVLYVHGAPGIGKTTLIRFFLEKIRETAEHTLVFSHRCHPQESVPFKMLDGITDALATYVKSLPDDRIDRLTPDGIEYLLQLFPVLKRIKRWEALGACIPLQFSEIQQRGFVALRELLSRLAADVPVVLFIDDIHCGDVDSLPFLSEWLKPTAVPPPLLTVLAFRREEMTTSACLKVLLAKHPPDGKRVLELPIEALAEAEAYQLAASLIDRDRSEEETHQLMAEAGGNPFLLEMLCGARLVPVRSLNAVLEHRMAEIPAAAREIVIAAVLAADPLPRQVLQEALEVREGSLIPLLQKKKLIRLAGAAPAETIEPYHDRIRETLAVGIPDDHRRSVHTSLADTLERTGATPETIGFHWKSAGNPAKAGPLFFAAAEKATDSLAFEHAANLYRQSLEELNHLATPLPNIPPRVELVKRFAVALRNAGRVSESADAFLNAATLAPPEAARRHRGLASDLLLNAGRVREGLDLFESLLQPIGLRLPRSQWKKFLLILLFRLRLRVRGYAFTERTETNLSEKEKPLWDIFIPAGIGLSGVDIDSFFYLHSYWIAKVLDKGDRTQISVALAFEVSILALMGNIKRAEKLLPTVQALAASLNDPIVKSHALIAECQVAAISGRMAEARDTCLEALDKVEKIDRTANMVTIFLDFLCITAGELIDLDRIRQAIEIASRLERLNERHSVAYTAIRCQSFYDLCHDNPAAAAENITAGLTMFPSPSYHITRFWALVARVDHALFTHAAQAFLPTFEAEAAALKRTGLWWNPCLRFIFRKSKIRLCLGLFHESGNEKFLKQAEKVTRLALRTAPAPGMHAAAVFHQGMGQWYRHNTAAAIDTFERAESQFDGAGMPFDAQVAKFCRGTLLDSLSGDDLTRSALEWMTAQGIVAPLTLMRTRGLDIQTVFVNRRI